MKWKTAELMVFGSRLRGDNRPDSDVDFLVTFETSEKWSLLDYIAMEDELAEIVGRSVDVVERRAVEGSENYIRRRHILEHPESVPNLDEHLLLDILLATRKALNFVDGVDQEAFSEDSVLKDALLFCLGTIGLAARKISADTKMANPRVPWDKVMHVPPGSRLWAHTSDERVWETVSNVLPRLEAEIEPLVPPDEGS